jgi:hypothetical protein
MIIMKTYKKLITGFIVLSMVMLAIGASGLMSAGHDSHNAVIPAQAENNDLVVTSVSWFSVNSTELPAPGSNGIPLYVTFVSYTNITDANISLNLSAYKSPLSYTYITGPDKNVRTYNVIPEIQAGHSYTIMQLVDINKTSTGSFYDENLSYYSSAISGNTTVTIPVGKPDIGVISYTTDPPVIYQNEKFVKLTVYTENTGTSAMRNVNFNVTSLDYNVVSPVNYSIAYYPQGKLLNFTFYINAKNITGSAPVDFHMDNTIYTLSTYIHGNGKSNFSIAVKNQNLVSDTKKQLMVFYLNNTGNNVYRDVEIHMLAPSVISIHVSSSNPLGALTANNITFAQIKPGQSITVTYIVDTAGTGSGTYPVQLLAEYHYNNTAETFDKVYTYNQKVVPTTTQQISSTLTEPLYAGMAALIIIIIGAIAAVSVHSRRKAKKIKMNRERDKEKNDKNSGEKP